MCPEITCPEDRPKAYYWPFGEGCFCETDDFLASPWNYVLPEEEPKDLTATKSIFDVEHNEFLLKNGLDVYAESSKMIFRTLSATALSRLNAKLVDTVGTRPSIADKTEITKRQDDASTTSTLPPDGTRLPSFVPPPKKDITPELIEQSLAVQPENTATVSSVIAHFGDEVITFLMQLSGIVANTIAMNASTTFPCGTIGAEPEPNIMLVPKHVQNGIHQTTVADCRCVAVNMVKPEVINYWIQKGNSIISLVGDNKVYNIDKIDTGAPIALTMLTAPSGPAKRQDNQASDVVDLPRRQVFKSAVCDRQCPQGMEPIPGDLLKTWPECGCLAKEGGDVADVIARALHQPDAYSATMNKEACEAMKCTNNADQPAMFNPFSLTCWCADPAYVEDNPNAWTGGTVKS